MMIIEPAVPGIVEDWARGEGPLYRRLAQAIRTAVEDGSLQGGQRLPPERELAEQLAVSRSTVVAAFDLLEEQGLIERRQGSGTRVRSRQSGQWPRAGLLVRGLRADTRAEAQADPDAPISLTAAFVHGANGMPAAAFDGLVDEVLALGETPGYVLMGYGPLRVALAERYTRLGLPTTPDQILVTSGAQQAIALVAHALVQRGDTVVVEDPTYHGAIEVLANAGARLVTVATGRNGADVPALAELFQRDAPRLAYLVPSFHNPTGGLMPEGHRRDLARSAQSTGTLLVEDETVAPLGLERQAPPPLAQFAPEGPVLTIGSMAKLFWAGLRVGWVRGAPAVLAELARVKATMDLGSAIPSQVMATRLVPAWEKVQSQRHQELAERLELMERAIARELPGWTWERPRGGITLWARLPQGNARAFVQVAERYGVVLTPGTLMSPAGNWDAYVRLPFGSEPPVIEEAARRLGRAWQAYTRRRDALPAVQSLIV